jgi:inosine/xanthosine triphosphatase
MFSCLGPSTDAPNDNDDDDNNTSSVESLHKEQDTPPATIILRIAVGSTNPSKIRAVEHALQTALQRCRQSNRIQCDIQGFSVESGVADQPWGDVETRQGAQNRAKAAYYAYQKTHGERPHLSVGMEGGLEWIVDGASNHGDKKNQQVFCNAWMAIYGRRLPLLVEIFACKEVSTYCGDRQPVFGVAKTALFPLPDALTQLVVQEKLELGDADDKVFSRVKSKHGQGTVGKLTDGLVDRSAYYEHALLLALIPWIRPDLYPPAPSL